MGDCRLQLGRAFHLDRIEERWASGLNFMYYFSLCTDKRLEVGISIVGEILLSDPLTTSG